MRKYVWIIMVAVLLSCSVIGCGCKDFYAILEKHPATKTYRDGIWKIRYHGRYQNYTDRIKSTTFCLSVDVEQDMTEKDMLDIMDYYEFDVNSKWDMNGNYMGERETDYTCYAVFYRGETDEEIRRMKYYNGKEVEILEEDKYCFASPDSRDFEDEIDKDTSSEPLP